MIPDDYTFGERLRRIRESKGLNQKELAKLVKLNPASISQIETDGRLPSFKVLIRLAKELNTTVGYLLNENIFEPPPHLQEIYKILRKSAKEELNTIINFAKFTIKKGGK